MSISVSDPRTCHCKSTGNDGPDTNININIFHDFENYLKNAGRKVSSKNFGMVPTWKKKRKKKKRKKKKKGKTSKFLDAGGYSRNEGERN